MGPLPMVSKPKKKTKHLCIWCLAIEYISIYIVEVNRFMELGLRVLGFGVGVWGLGGWGLVGWSLEFFGDFQPSKRVNFLTFFLWLENPKPHSKPLTLKPKLPILSLKHRSETPNPKAQLPHPGLLPGPNPELPSASFLRQLASGKFWIGTEEESGLWELGFGVWGFTSVFEA